ncbi:MAG: hypothetical protein HN855_11785 [Anaerolineae bacterium]|jgi:hypothetical protein|nr:hypothetical protein [Anaerolineae bacterium]MBT7071334.1 hypothetical protein [Anaerolineae bacterium]MBT7325834.1 hypothetical protein [Anaerolineae bacterium]
MKVIATIAAIILIFFGVLIIWGAFDATPQPEWICMGSIFVLIGFGLIWLAQRMGKKDAEAGQNVSVNIDLPGEVNLETMQCQACGGSLTSNNIKMVAGAPMVVCPYCDTSYQVTEEPKW